MTDPNCDPESGECTPAELEQKNIKENQDQSNIEIIYVGDPMCSWCYGISPELKKLKAHQEFPFKIVVGGLRPGGGDPWNDQMKDFLAHHWQQVHDRSGQPFGYDLLDRETFNYDTEPSCRATVAARLFVPHQELEFFEAVQIKFYRDSEDPTEEAFYESICKQFDIPFNEFLHAFRSEELKKLTHQEFMLNRQWGVSGYPTVLLKRENQLHMVAHGYATFEQMNQIIAQIKTLEIS